MPQRSDGFKTIDIILPELQLSPSHFHRALRALNVRATQFPNDHHQYFGPDDLTRISKWIADNRDTLRRLHPTSAKRPPPRMNSMDTIRHYLDLRFHDDSRAQ